MKIAFLLFTSLALTLVARAESPDSIPDPLKKNHSWIYDGAHVLNNDDKHRIDNALEKLNNSKKAQILVVTVQTLDGMSIEDWSNDVFRRIGVGTKGQDNGAMFVFAIKDRKSHIEVGYGLEDRLTDARVGAILRDQIRPAFRASNYGQGIYDGVDTAINYINGGTRPPVSSGSTSSSGSSRSPASSSSGSNSFPSSGGNFPSTTTTYTPPSTGSGGSGGGALLLLSVLAVGGVGAVAYAATRPRKCPRCNKAMTQSEASDAELTDAQQCERSMGSRTFNKFSCPSCGYSEIVPKDAMFSGVTTCSTCGNRTARTHRVVLTQPTYDFSGEEQITEECEYPPCRHINRYTRSLPRLHRSTSSTSTGGFIGGISGGSSGGFDSGSSSSGGSYDGGSSGSFGGGDSGGGGASSSW